MKEIDKQYAKDNQSLNAHVYITHGADEYVPYVEAIKRYIEQIEAKGYGGLDLSLASIEGMRHVGMTSEGLTRGIGWAFSDLRLEGPSMFERMDVEASRNRGPRPSDP